MKLFLITALLMFAVNGCAKQNIDSLYTHVAFETGFLLRKNIVIKINKEVIVKEKINTIPQHGWAGSYDFKYLSEDKVVIKIGLFSHKLNKNKIVKGYYYVKINRMFFLNFYTYDKAPSFYY